MIFYKHFPYFFKKKAWKILKFQQSSKWCYLLNCIYYYLIYLKFVTHSVVDFTLSKRWGPSVGFSWLCSKRSWYTTLSLWSKKSFWISGTVLLHNVIYLFFVWSLTFLFISIKLAGTDVSKSLFKGVCMREGVPLTFPYN